MLRIDSMKLLAILLLTVAIGSCSKAFVPPVRTVDDVGGAFEAIELINGTKPVHYPVFDIMVVVWSQDSKHHGAAIMGDIASVSRPTKTYLGRKEVKKFILIRCWGLTESQIDRLTDVSYEGIDYFGLTELPGESRLYKRRFCIDLSTLIQANDIDAGLLLNTDVMYQPFFQVNPKTFRIESATYVIDVRGLIYDKQTGYIF